ncbi:MAG TPA: SpoIIE family protein phosphatase, partial [Candidatus Ozemobacteraceae bacterium]
RVVERLEALPMRFRLTALFLMATALPLGLALILGGIGVMDRTEVIATESDRHALDRLHRAETGYSLLVDRFRVVSERLRDWRAMREARIGTLGPAALRLQERDIVQDIELRDGSAAPIFTTIDPVVKGSNQAIDAFSRIAIRRHAPNRITGSADKVGANELIGEALLSSDDVGLASMLRSRGKVWTFKMGTNPTLWFWDVYADQATGPAFICTTNQLEWIYSSYLRTRAAKPAESGSPHILSMRYGPDTAFDHFLPALRGSGAEELRHAVIRSQESGRILTRSLRIGGQEYWVVIKPETVLGMHVFADLTPAADQLHALAPFRKRLALTAGLALLLSLLSASLLASLFLVPISDLGEGVSAIRRRDSSFRIPLRRPDEFGAVAAAFNKLLSEFEELEYGRVVQESLLPVEPEAPEGYEIRSFRRAATDLAGDYHDVVRLEDGRLAVVLGDVTGHGIAAALPMAMAKATVEFETIARWGYPGPLMGRLNALFNRELKPRQKFMTMASILLDPVKHTVEYDNAGHPYPLVYVAAETASRELQLPSMPLGIRTNRTSKPVRQELGPGDAILLYTDGLVECPGRVNGDPFGYDTLQRLFTSLCARPGATASTILAGLVEALDAWRQEGPLPDDVTLLLLRRRESGSR